MSTTLKLTLREGIPLKHLVMFLDSVDQLSHSLYLAYGNIDETTLKKICETDHYEDKLICLGLNDLYVESWLGGSLIINITSELGQVLKIIAEWIISIVDPLKRKKEKHKVRQIEIKNELLQKELEKSEFLLNKEMAEAAVDFVNNKAIPMYDALKDRGFPDSISVRLFAGSLRWISQINRIQDESGILISLDVSERLPEKKLDEG